MPSFIPVRADALQRKCDCGQHTIAGGECAECSKKKQTLQRASFFLHEKGAEGEGKVPPIVHEVLRSSGQPLDPATRAFMEPRFGHDFSHVRVHTDAKAAESAQAVNALAYTVGRDVVFGGAQCAPNTVEGRRLIAHELTHVLQQEPGMQQLPATLEATAPGDTTEQEAHLAATAVMEGRAVNPTPNDAPKIARQIPPPTSPTPAGPTAPAAPTPTPALPTAKFERFVTEGAVRCCRAAGPKGCPLRLGAAKPVDPSPRNGMNLVASISGHKPGVEYGFVQVIHFRQCARLSAALGGGWSETGSKGPGADDSPIAEATCRIPDARNEITMTDAPGLAVALGSPAIPNLEEITHRVNATDWVIAREPSGRWQPISDLFPWHSVTRVQRNAAGNLELTPGANRIDTGYTRIGGCPPP